VALKKAGKKKHHQMKNLLVKCIISIYIYLYIYIYIDIYNFKYFAWILLLIICLGIFIIWLINIYNKKWDNYRINGLILVKITKEITSVKLNEFSNATCEPPNYVFTQCAFET